jgi:hypothetical protein
MLLSSSIKCGYQAPLSVWLSARARRLLSSSIKYCNQAQSSAVVKLNKVLQLSLIKCSNPAQSSAQSSSIKCCNPAPLSVCLSARARRRCLPDRARRHCLSAYLLARDNCYQARSSAAIQLNQVLQSTSIKCCNPAQSCAVIELDQVLLSSSIECLPICSRATSLPA